jgi:hypothetical protein
MYPMVGYHMSGFLKTTTTLRKNTAVFSEAGGNLRKIFKLDIFANMISITIKNFQQKDVILYKYPAFRTRTRIRMFLTLLDPHPDPLFFCPDLAPSINNQKN